MDTEEKYIPNPSAFPYNGTNDSTAFDEGMKLRDYFAAKAMQALIANPTYSMWAWQQVSENAYDIADNMLEQREQ